MKVFNNGTDCLLPWLNEKHEEAEVVNDDETSSNSCFFHSSSKRCRSSSFFYTQSITLLLEIYVICFERESEVE